MPDWKQILVEIQSSGSTHDIIRRKYIDRLCELTKRNVIIYYSGWLQKGDLAYISPNDFAINDSDKNGFMTCIHKMDKSIGLDLVLHTPGGDTAATESLVNYLRAMFGSNIRAIVPQLALSAGTMIACACQQILMGKHSSLGPIDPQIRGLPAHGIIEEFETAKKEVASNPICIPLWQPIIAKYHPTLIGECEKAIQWSQEIVKDWLNTGMFNKQSDAEHKIKTILTELGSHALTKSHARHISSQKAKEIGLNIVDLEDEGNDELQDAVLSVHHACILTFSSTLAYKIIQNQSGVAYIQLIKKELA